MFYSASQINKGPSTSRNGAVQYEEDNGHKRDGGQIDQVAWVQGDCWNRKQSKWCVGDHPLWPMLFTSEPTQWTTGSNSHKNWLKSACEACVCVFAGSEGYPHLMSSPQDLTIEMGFHCRQIVSCLRGREKTWLWPGSPGTAPEGCAGWS